LPPFQIVSAFGRFSGGRSAGPAESPVGELNADGCADLCTDAGGVDDGKAHAHYSHWLGVGSKGVHGMLTLDTGVGLHYVCHRAGIEHAGSICYASIFRALRLMRRLEHMEHI